MPFIPLAQKSNSGPADFPNVSPEQQASRDAVAERVVAAEFSQDMPDENRAALTKEYRLRFGKEPPEVQQGFIPLDASDAQQGFTPIAEQADDKPSLFAPALETMKDIGRVYPVAEAGANLVSQAVALPVAGIAGMGAAATKALGLTQANPDDVVNKVGGALTYQPKTDAGKHLTGVVTLPFEKLQEAGQYAGGKTLDATGSPIAATTVDTAINALPMLIAPAVKGAKALIKECAPVIENAPEAVPAQAVPVAASAIEQPRGFVPLAPDTPQAVNPGRGAAETGQGIPATASIQENAPAAGLAANVAGDAPALRQAVVQAPEAPRQVAQVLPDTQTPSVPVRQASDPVALTGEQPADSAAGPATRLQPEGALGQGGDSRGFTPIADSGHEVAPAVAEIRSGLGSESGAVGTEGLTTADLQQVNTDPVIAKTNRLAELNDAFDGPNPRPLTIAEIKERQALKHEATTTAAVNRLGQISGEESAINAHLDNMAQKHGDGPEFIGQRTQLQDRLSSLAVERNSIAKSHPAAIADASENAVQPSGLPTRQPLPQTTADTTTKPIHDMATGVQNAWAPGANYAPLINDARAPVSGAKSVADLPPPLRREKILGEFAKDLGTTIYEGRVKGKRLGFFRPKLQEVRIKKASDLEVAAHEIGHLLDDRVPAISRAWRTDTALRDELRAISYDHSKVNEGYAEGVRLYLTQPDVLQSKAPLVHKWLDDFANTHEYGPALRKAQKGMTGWFGQDALNRARSKIGNHKPLADYFDGAWDKFRQSTVDDLHGIMRMERDLTGKINPIGAYESARLSRASHSITDGALRFGAPVKKADGSFTFKGKGLEEILKPVAQNLDDAMLYFVGRSSRELMTQSREHLFTPGEIDAMLKLKRPEFDTAFKEYQAWNKAVLDFAEAQGVINPEARRLWQRTQYLPFQRVGSTDGFKSKPGDWSGIKALTGGTENIRDVLGNMVSNAAQLIDKSVKNEARLKIAALANETGGGKFMVKIDAETRPVKVDKQQALDGLLKAMGIDRHAPDLPKNVRKLIEELEGEMEKTPGMMEFFVGNQPPAGGNVVAVLKGGKPTWYEVGDPVLYRALSALDRPPKHWIVKWLGLPKRIGQTSITLTPDFMVANIARDTIMGSIMSRSGFRPVMDSLQGMRLRMTHDQLYKDYISNGGGLSSIYMDDSRFKAKLERFYSRQGIDYHTVLDAPDKILNAVETIADAFEMSTRIGEYKRAIDKGEHPRHAAYQGREVSTDFAMRGDSKVLGFMYDTVIFLKAAVVSMDRLYRGVAHDPNKGAIAVKSGILALASVALYLHNRDNPRYADLADWDRDSNWHFFIGDQHFRYPKIWEVGALSSIAERTAEKLIADDPKGLGADFVRIVKNTFGLNGMPQAIAPLYEQATNRNSFTNAPIETPGMESMQPFLRAKPNTSETLKAAGMATRNLPESLQINPVRTEALLRGYLNTWALYGLALSDKAFFSDKLPEGRVDQLPVVRRFYSQDPPQHTKYETMFYDMLGEAKRLRGTMRELDKLGHRDIADDKELDPMASEAKPLERAAKNLSGINADMRQVRRSDASPAEKRRRLDELTVERNALLKATVLDAQLHERKQ